MHYKEIKITFSCDGLNLNGFIHMPNIDKPPVVIGIHGLFSNCQSQKQVELARACNDMGIAFFRFDHRGCGESDGEFKEVTSLENRYMDFIAAKKFVSSHSDLGDKLGVFGSSMGGCLALLASSYINIDAIVTLAGPVSVEPVWKALVHTGQHELLDKDFYKNSSNFLKTKSHVTLKNILVFQGDADEIVPPSDAQAIYDMADEPKKIIIFKNGNHRLTEKEHQEIFFQESAQWFKEFLQTSR